jgi:hypothetical protein
MKLSYPTVRTNAFAFIACVVLGVSANAQDDEFEPVDLPDNIAGKVEGLDQEKIDFLVSGISGKWCAR